MNIRIPSPAMAKAAGNASMLKVILWMLGVGGAFGALGGAIGYEMEQTLIGLAIGAAIGAVATLGYFVSEGTSEFAGFLLYMMGAIGGGGLCYFAGIDHETTWLRYLFVAMGVAGGLAVVRFIGNNVDK